MKPSGREGGLPWQWMMVVGLILGLITTIAVAVVEAETAREYYTDLTHISPCHGGIGWAWCPAEVGLTFAQLGRDQNINGTFVATFLVVPAPPPTENASSLSLRVYNYTTNATLTLLNVTLTLPNGSVLAVFQPTGTLWSTTATSEIWEVSVLTVASEGNLSGDRMSLWNAPARDGAVLPIE